MTPNPLRRLHKGPDLLKWLMLLILSAFAYALFFRLTLRPSSDISIHTTWAGEGTFRDLSSFLHHGAHPLWHMLVVCLTLVGLPLEVSAALITALCKLVEVWLIHRLFTLYLSDRVSRAGLTALAFVCSVVACLWLPFYNPTVYLGVGTPNTWHSCTQLIAMVFMLVCVPYTAHCYDRFVRLQADEKAMLPWREPLLLGALLLMSLLAKPTFMQAFLPAACLFFLYQWIRHPKNSRFFVQVLVCVLPAIVFMIVQYLYYFGIIVPFQAGMVLQISFAKCMDVLIRVLLMLAFPLYVLLITRRDGKPDTFLILTVLFTAVSVVEFLILGESGRRAADGNFGWGMMGAALMLWVVCMIRYFSHGLGVRRADGKLCAARVIGHLLLCWHLISGLYYMFYLFTTNAAL